jgi:hypothetical protein
MVAGGPFLTALDSRGAVKGSRDPLGAQSIWVRFGRYAVGNLTTQSTLVPDFTVLLVGLYLAERVAAAADGAVQALEVFLRWEQLAAYVRQRKNVRGFRGIERVRTRLEEQRSGAAKVTLSSAPQYQVLGDQRVYGIWGLYMVASQTSGLVLEGTHRLSPAGRNLVEAAFVPTMTRGNPNLIEKLVRHLGRIEPWVVHLDGRDADLEAAVARILVGKLGKVEAEAYRRHLIRGEHRDVTQGRQRELAALLLEHPGLALEAQALRGLAKEARRISGKDSSLAHRLERIRVCEALLAPATQVFSWLLGQGRRKRAEIVKDLDRVLGGGVKAIDPAELDDVRDDLSGASSGAACERWIAIGRAFADGESGAAVDGLLAHNRDVMRERNGSSPWIEFADDKLVVHFSEEASALFEKRDLPSLWVHPYFIESLQTVVAQIEGAG